jgi:pimeloyl-ACP methyl ester carboxylesterase
MRDPHRTAVRPDQGVEEAALQTVLSADGTVIAYDQDGTGPSLLLVHGTTGNRTSSFAAIRPFLGDSLTVMAMDRRGRGDSGDGPAYAIEREFEDVLAVVDALRAPVWLFGHSFGAQCALGAALQSDKLAGLMLYEPWIAVAGETLYTVEQLDQFDRFLAADDREGLMRMFLVEVVGIPANEVEAGRATPAWGQRLAIAHTIPREARAELSYRLPAIQARRLAIPVLLIRGGDSPPLAKRVIARLEGALPRTRTVVLAGQHHAALRSAPDLLAGVILDFCSAAA